MADLWYNMVIVLSYLSGLSENGNNDRKQCHNRIETLLNEQTGPFYYPFLAVMWTEQNCANREQETFTCRLKTPGLQRPCYLGTLITIKRTINKFIIAFDEGERSPNLASKKIRDFL